MAHTNRSRVILGGILAGAVISVIEYIANGVLMKEAWGKAMQALGKPTGITSGAIVAFIIWGFLLGIAAIWLYAAIRPRYGAGPNTAIRAGLAAWAIGAFLPNLASYPMGFFPTGLLAISCRAISQGAVTGNTLLDDKRKNILVALLQIHSCHRGNPRAREQ